MTRSALALLLMSILCLACGETEPLSAPDASDTDASTTTDAAPTCPPVQPTLGDRCTAPDILDCYYGEECCCGRCGPSTYARCSRGTWGFSATDFCLGGNLCDGGPGNDVGDRVDAGGG